MSYRDDLIRRLQQDGLWDQFTVEQQQRFQNLTDEQARHMMVFDDQREMGDEEAVGLFGMMSLFEVAALFRGSLLDHERDGTAQLSKAGTLLVEFLLELRERDVPSGEVDAGLQRISPMVIAALTTLYKRQDG